MKNKLKNPQFYIVPLMIVYGAIYINRMFMNNPWYDELYTYYSFISKGPVYAAIHWPLPNNHMGYSTLSGFLSYLGNATIALRGVSFVCAVANIYLVYVLARKFMSERLSYLAVFVYAGVFQVHNMAVQGRGYTLSTTCYIVALLMLYTICKGTPQKINYICYAIALILGIWAVPSSTFWVIPVCFTGGIYLLFNKEYKKLIKLIAASLAAALGALMIYFLVWLAIGSNLLSKDPNGVYAGVYQLSIIKEHPLLAAKTGLDYMLASPYIQSMDRSFVIKDLINYLTILFDQFYSNMGIVIIVIVAVTFVVALVRFIKDRTRFLEAYLLIGTLFLPIMLIVQSVQPYLRVFSFYGLVLSLSIMMYVKMAVFKAGADNTKICTIVTAILGVFFIGLLFTPKYTMPMAGRENDIADVLYAMEDNGIKVDAIDSIYYTDDYQKYVIKFFFDDDPAEAPLGEASFVLVSDTMLDENITAMEWPLLTTYSDFDYDLLYNDYENVAETDKYIVYRKK